jgi:hypothetical protein
MNTVLKTFVGACFVVAMGADVSVAPWHVGIRDAAAYRPHPVARTAVVVGVTVAATNTANANAAAQANANATAQANAAAATANANAAAANAAAATASANQAAATSAPAPAPTPSVPAAPAVGSIVTALPPGCVAQKLNDVDYQRCGATYYRPSMMGTNLVFVVAKP